MTAPDILELSSTQQMHFEQYLSIRTERAEDQLEQDMMMVQEILEELSKFEEQVKIPQEHWLKALQELS